MAHGTRGGRRLALDAATARLGPPSAVVAHSMGTVVAALALADGRLRPERLVLGAPEAVEAAVTHITGPVPAPAP